MAVVNSKKIITTVRKQPSFGLVSIWPRRVDFPGFHGIIKYIRDKEDKVDKLDKEYVVRIVLETVCELGEARQAWVGTVLVLTDAKRDLALADALAKREATQLAGGVKALGPNAESREQALTIALEQDTKYKFVEAAYDEAFEKEARAKQRTLSLLDTLKTMRDVLGILGDI